jgi:hypothetical protein
MGDWISTRGTSWNTANDYSYQFTSPITSYTVPQPQWVQAGQSITITGIVYDPNTGQMCNPVMSGGSIAKKMNKRTESAFEWLKSRVEEIRLTPAMMMMQTA